MSIIPEHIIYEDNHLLVVIKPPNMPVMADRSGDVSLLDTLKEYIRIKYHKPGAAYLGLVHRLDRPAGGLMVFARTSKAAGRLSEQLRRRALQRVYWAVVHGQPPMEITLSDWLIKDNATNTVSVAAPNKPGAKEAVLHGWRLECREGLSLLRIRLETGRPHQIRVQCANAGYPLLGDHRYGAARSGNLALWSRELTLSHPITGEPVFFSYPPPVAWPWTLFAEQQPNENPASR